jgi:hypothetical protein
MSRAKEIEQPRPPGVRRLGTLPLHAEVAAPLILSLTFLALLVATWRRFGDPFLDYGVQMYGALQVMHGWLPIRDFEWLYGPFSVLWNGLWFSFFGATNTTLLWVNVCLLALASTLVFRLFRRWYGAWSAAAVVLTFFFCFAFSHSTEVGNYNYLVPYSAEALHGIYLGLAAVALAETFVARRSAGAAAALGVVAALAFLTKAEVALGALGVWAAAHLMAALVWHDARACWQRCLISAGAFAGTLVAIVLALTPWMSLRQRLVFLAGAWRLSFTAAAGTRWNVETMGFDAPLAHTLRLVASTGACVALAAGVAIVALLITRARVSKSASTAMSIAGAIVLVLLTRRIELWVGLARSLPMWCALFIGVGLWHMVRGDADSLCARPGPWLWAVWAEGVIARMLLAARVEQYGFVQAMPAVLVLAGWLVACAPELAGRWRADRRLVLAASLALLVSFNAVNAQRSLRYLRAKTDLWLTPTVNMKVYGPDVDPRIPILRQAMGYLEQHLSAGDRLLIIPEGSFLAFSINKLMATRYPQLTPTEVAGFGETNIVDDFERHHPDVVVIVHKHTQPALFGQAPDYGQQIMAWVRGHYQRVALFGAEPHQAADRFGVEVFRRAAQAQSSL